MDIAHEPRPNGGRMVATIDGEQVGWVRWRVEGGVWWFDSLFVADGHRGQGIGGALMLAAKQHREANGAPPWRNALTTKAGSSAVQGHINRNYDTDPRVGVTDG